MLKAQAIKDQHPGLFTHLYGDLDNVATHCDSPSDAGMDSIVHASEIAEFDEARRRHPAIIIVHRSIADYALSVADPVGCVFAVPVIPMAMAVLLKYFDRKPERFTQWGQRHSTAVIHESARIGKGAFIGPYCVIGADSSIGEHCLIGAHTVIENEVSIGDRTILHPQVFIGSGCRVGSDCEIHPHSSIGSDGFGYAADKDGKPIKISHLGNVVIGNEVEIGSNCAIDRAKLSSTHIRSGTKLDNICHIAHNCDLGENGLFTAGFMMGGSTKIGRQFVTGGNSVVTAHVTIADNVMLAGRSNVTKSITEPGPYGGYPLQSLKDAMKTAVSIGHLNDIRKNLNRVMKRLYPRPDA